MLFGKFGDTKLKIVGQLWLLWQITGCETVDCRMRKCGFGVLDLCQGGGFEFFHSGFVSPVLTPPPRCGFFCPFRWLLL